MALPLLFISFDNHEPPDYPAIEEVKSVTLFCEYGYFRDQVNDGCSSGGLSRKSDFGFFLSSYLFAVSKKFETRSQTPSVKLF
jgi:hypothetical protein